ncbi:hypothetical protein KCU77_g17655, partial [Aureobasidium melanogenum]
MRPSPTKLSIQTTYSRKSSNTSIQYAPLSTPSSSILIEYAPLSSTTSLAFTSHPTIPTASTGLAPSSSRTADSRFSAPADPQARRAPLGSTVVVLILLGFMLAMATMMWLAESKGRKKSQRSECQERKIMSKPRKNVEPVGLGIILHPADEGRKEIEVSERLKGWLSIVVERGKSANMTGRWTEFAVSRTRTDLGMNAEEGLLLPVRESERIGIKKDQIGIELDADPRVLRDAKK